VSEKASVHAPKIKLRQLNAADEDTVVGLLLRGFDDRDEAYWRRGWARLSLRALPGDYPRFGYGLDVDGTLQGVLLLIFSRSDAGDARANVSSWYVAPEFRLYANLLLTSALRFKDVTFVNVSPAPHTLDTIAAQGFVTYVRGIFVALAALAPPRWGVEIAPVAPRLEDDARLLERHAALGCLSFELRHEGRTYPFVFLPRLSHRSGARFAQLVYCRDARDFVRFAGPLGRLLLRKGFFFVTMDAAGPVEGLVGRLFEQRKVKVYRGPVKPRLCDLSDTELVWFGP
jgi:hypothetical protein